VAQWTAERGRTNDGKINVQDDGNHVENSWTHRILKLNNPAIPTRRGIIPISTLVLGQSSYLIGLFDHLPTVVEPLVIQELYREQQNAQETQQRRQPR
jgi:hypothetical protein